MARKSRGEGGGARPAGREIEGGEGLPAVDGDGGRRGAVAAPAEQIQALAVGGGDQAVERQRLPGIEAVNQIEAEHRRRRTGAGPAVARSAPRPGRRTGPRPRRGSPVPRRHPRPGSRCSRRWRSAGRRPRRRTAGRRTHAAGPRAGPGRTDRRTPAASRLRAWPDTADRSWSPPPATGRPGSATGSGLVQGPLTCPWQRAQAGGAQPIRPSSASSVNEADPARTYLIRFSMPVR